MRSEVTTQPGLPEAKKFARRTDEVEGMSGLRKRWIALLGIGTISLSLLFVWGFLHLILALIFPKSVVVH
ncbi:MULTISPECIES: hypothetical protein [unclassified Paraburkholderia]|uniref:hypothetical protein n=1 Tax=unclassified Paraburkholderia TaxID=2615204 RepID=UPI00160FE083|nr:MULTISPECIES: hypothetical protein [unclassified Paraburkholderia]MBB5447975.1 hypothetical protein [Paraburkholderia sp. WSM4177]MBB5488414.1 hypothetical protein [Paraburkholderia sp. WSM4180]